MRQAFRAQMKRLACAQGNLEEMRDGLNRVPVPQCDAFVMTMAIAPAEQGRANIVRAIDEQDIFPFRQSPGNRIVVFHESRV